MPEQFPTAIESISPDPLQVQPENARNETSTILPDAHRKTEAYAEKMHLYSMLQASYLDYPRKDPETQMQVLEAMPDDMPEILMHAYNEFLHDRAKFTGTTELPPPEVIQQFFRGRVLEEIVRAQKFQNN